MIDIPKRRLLDRITGSPTFIGTGTEFVGDMACNGDLSVAGIATGECRIKGAFLLPRRPAGRGRSRQAAR
ncbi:MAG: hypothetical protein RLZZ403_1032 [Pseudomonadota bacterium]